MKIKIGIVLICCLLSLSSIAKGIDGSYSVSGKAYQSNGEIIRNGQITVELNGEKKIILTDSLGNYQFSVDYATACPSVVRGLKKWKANKKINPKFINLTYADENERIRNKWRRNMSKGHRQLDLKFS